MNKRLKEIRERDGKDSVLPDFIPDGLRPHERDELYELLEKRKSDRGELLTMIDDCADYMKEGETPAVCIARNRNDVQSVMKLLAKEKTRIADLESEVGQIARDRLTILKRAETAEETEKGFVRTINRMSKRIKKLEAAEAQLKSALDDSKCVRGILYDMDTRIKAILENEDG